MQLTKSEHENIPNREYGTVNISRTNREALDKMEGEGWIIYWIGAWELYFYRIIQA